MLRHRVRSPWQTPIIYYVIYIYVMFSHLVAELWLVRTWSGASLRGVPLSLPLGAVMVALVDVSGLSIYCYQCQYTSGVAHCSYHVRYIHTNRRLPPSIISGWRRLVAELRLVRTASVA